MNSRYRAILVGKFSWTRFLRSLILVPVAAIFGLSIIGILFADRLIFRPHSSSYRERGDIKKIVAENNVQIAVTFLENPDAEYSILFSHGNAEDLGTIMPFLDRMRDSGFNVLAYDYQGYGTSSGSPSEANTYADIRTAYNYLVTQEGIPPNKIILHGRSLGGGVAVDLASKEVVAGLILESTFTSAFRVLTRFPILPFDKFESIEKIKDVRSPVLVIHGTNDWTIPSYHGQKLFESANDPKYMLRVEGAGHNDLFYRDEAGYLDAISTFANSLSPR